MYLNEVLIGKIDNLDHSGRGIIRGFDKIIFVSNTLEGEEVKIKIIKISKKYYEGEVIDFIKKSEKRIISKCEHYNICGGCSLSHMSYDDELVYKYNKVKEVLKKFGNVDEYKVKDILSNKLPFNYRNKGTFKVEKKLGYYEKGSNKLVSISSCLLLHSKINEIVNILNSYDLSNIYEVVIRYSAYEDESIVILKIKDNINEDKLINYLKNITQNIVLYYNKDYRNIFGKGYIIDNIGDKKYKISPDSFFQINNACAKIMYDKVLEYLGKDKSSTLLDLYCGAGTIGIYLSNYVKSVIGLEINKYSVSDAKENLLLNDVSNAKFICKDASLVTESELCDNVVVDPPRSGLDKKGIDFILNHNFNKVIYVSCDPVTLARDIKLLSDKYELLEVTPIDMFPNTYHVESVCVLEKR